MVGSVAVRVNFAAVYPAPPPTATAHLAQNTTNQGNPPEPDGYGQIVKTPNTSLLLVAALLP
jgi:hypothetical protein